jgi:hypothetical protein
VTLFGQWRKERRNRAVQAREDHAWTFEKRSMAYLELIQELQAASDALFAIHRRGRRADLVSESQERVRAKLAVVEVFGSRKVVELGWRAWSEVLLFESSLVPAGTDDDERAAEGEKLTAATKTVIDAVRVDLHVDPPPTTDVVLAERKSGSPR